MNKLNKKQIAYRKKNKEERDLVKSRIKSKSRFLVYAYIDDETEFSELDSVTALFHKEAVHLVLDQLTDAGKAAGYEIKYTNKKGFINGVSYVKDGTVVKKYRNICLKNEKFRDYPIEMHNDMYIDYAEKDIIKRLEDAGLHPVQDDWIGAAGGKNGILVDNRMDRWIIQVRDAGKDNAILVRLLHKNTLNLSGIYSTQDYHVQWQKTCDAQYVVGYILKHVTHEQTAYQSWKGV